MTSIPTTQTSFGRAEAVFWRPLSNHVDQAIAGLGTPRLLDLQASASLGWAAGAFTVPFACGDLTLAAFTNEDGVTTDYYAFADGQDASLLTSIGGSLFQNKILATLSLPVDLNPDSGFGQASLSPFRPGFLTLQEAAAPGPFIMSGFAMRYVTEAGNESALAPITGVTVWGNELGRLPSEAKLVDGPWPIGPIIVTYGPSSLDPTQQAFYIRPVSRVTPLIGGVSPADVASEILVSTHPTDVLVPNYERFQAVCNGEGDIIIYYEVEDPSSGFRGTAVMVYNPLASEDITDYTAAWPAQLNLSGVRLRPTFILADEVPADSKGNGAGIHPASSQIVLATQRPADDTTDQQIRLRFSRGTGRVLDSVSLLVDGTNHPDFFGGKWENAAPNRSILIDSIGWQGNIGNPELRVVCGMQHNELNGTYKEFVNTYRPDLVTDHEPRHMLLGLISMKRDEEGGGVGTLSIDSRNAAPFFPDSSAWQGYALGPDFADANSLLRFDNILANTIVPTVGPFAIENDTVPGPGVISTGRVWFQDDSSVTIDNTTGSLDPDGGITVKMWLFLEARTPAAIDRNIVSKPRPSVPGVPTFALLHDTVTNELDVIITNTSGTFTVTTTNPLERGKWYHVTVTYETGPGRVRVYLFGRLVDTFVLGGAGLLVSEAGTPWIIGDDSGVGGNISTFMRVDDHMIGGTAVSILEAHWSFAYEVSSPNGPAQGARDPELPDGIVDTASEVWDETGQDLYTDTVITATRREAVYILGDPNFDGRQIMYDLWTRQQGQDPVYLGPLPMPDDPALPITEARLRTNKNRLPMQWFRKAGTGLYSLYHAVMDENGATGGRTTLYEYEFDPTDLLNTLTQTIVCHINHTPIPELGFAPYLTSPGLAVVDWESAPDDRLVILAIHGEGAGFTNSPEMNFVRPQDFGVTLPSASVPSITSGFIPDYLTTATSNGFNYTALLTGLTDEHVAGIAARKTKASQGFDPALLGDRTVQVVYGLGGSGAGSVPPNYGPPPNASEPQLFETASIVATVDAFPGTGVTIDRGASQLDKLGFDLEPFAPIKFLETPDDSETQGGAFGDQFIIGIRDTREIINLTGDPSKRQHGGLFLYKVERLGSWNPTALGALTLDTMPSLYDGLHGASAAIVARSVLDSSSNDISVNDDYVVMTSTSAPDGQDRAATVYLTPDEVGSLYAPAFSGAVVPVLHPGQEAYTCLWSDWKPEARNFGERPTGAAVLKGGWNQAVNTVRWNEEVPTFVDFSGGPPTSIIVNQAFFKSFGSYQGGAFSVENRIQRFWGDTFQRFIQAGGFPPVQALTGLAIFPAIGGKNFKSGKKEAFSGPETFTIGSKHSYETFDPVDFPAETEIPRAEPVGITDTANGDALGGGVGSYYYIAYALGASDTPLNLSVYHSEWGSEMTNGSASVAWAPTNFTLEDEIHRGMRVVNVGGRDYLYFIYGTATKSRLMFVPLPLFSSGYTTQMEDPSTVAVFDFVAESRIYAVPVGDNLVAVYVGDYDDTSARRTTVLVHNPETDTLVREPKVLLSNYSPFPFSYGACPGRQDYNLPLTQVFLEPNSSREGDASYTVDTRQLNLQAGQAGSLPVPWEEEDHGGNAWLLLTCVTDGYFVLDQRTVTPDEVVPYWGDSESDFRGGKVRSALRPHFIQRATENVGEDVSTEYVLTLSHIPAQDAGWDFGGATYSPFRISSRTFPQGLALLPGSAPAGTQPKLIPGSLQLEVIGGVLKDGHYYSVIGGVASKLENWRVTDANNEASSFAVTAVAGDRGNYQDHLCGAKALVLSPNRAIVVAWYKRTSNL